MSEGFLDFTLDEIPEEFYADQLQIDVDIGIIEFRLNLKQILTTIFEDLLTEIPLRRTISEEERQAWAKAHVARAYTHFLELAESSLQETINELWVESVFHALQSEGSIEKNRMREMLGEFIQRLRAKSLGPERRLRYGRGGANKQAKYQWDEQKYIDFATAVDELRPLWDFITSFFQREGYDAGCPRAVKRLSQFETLSQKSGEVPEDLLRRVFQRQTKRGSQNYPIAFALEHAKRLRGIEYPYKFDALNNAYKEGKKLLKSRQP